MKDQLHGQVAIVTGGGRGFGEAIALRLAEEGATVTVTARSRNQLDEVAARIGASGGRALAVPADVRSRADIAEVVARTTGEFGPVSLLVNNAGVPGPFGPVWTVDPEEWLAAQDIHIRAPFLFIAAVLPAMVERHAGRIITVSAMAAQVVAPNLSAYCLGKTAQNRVTELFAAESKDHGVSLFAINPGFVFTALAEETIGSVSAQRWLPDMIDRLIQKQADPNGDRDLARCAQRCVDLASGRYDGLSGQYIDIDDDLAELVRRKASGGE
jgi:NAD(P)-dependent dehydrogenase (short-subunit alcohol dehydrogenase family)